MNRTATRWFVILVVLAILGMALWTTLTVRDLSTDPESQEVLEKWKKLVE